MLTTQCTPKVTRLWYYSFVSWPLSESKNISILGIPLLQVIICCHLSKTLVILFQHWNWRDFNLQSNSSYTYTESLKHDTNSASESRGEKDDMISTPTNTFGSSSTPHSITKHNLVFLHIPKNAGTRPLKRMHLPLAYHGVTACLYETNEIKTSRSPSATPTRTSILNMSTCKWIWTNCISSWQTFYNGQSTLLALPLFKIYQLIYTKNLW